MKNRTIQYFKQAKARKVLQHPLEADLMTFLSATLNLSRNNVVKRHIEQTLHQLYPTQHRMSA